MTIRDQFESILTTDRPTFAGVVLVTFFCGAGFGAIVMFVVLLVSRWMGNA